METAIVEHQPVINIPEVGATNEIVRFEPQAQSAPLAKIESPEIVDATWRLVDDTPRIPMVSSAIGVPKPVRYEAPVPAPEPKPYTLNQQLADEWQQNGWMFERPVPYEAPAPKATRNSETFGVASSRKSAPRPSRNTGALIGLNLIDNIAFSVDGLANLSDTLANLVDRLLGFLFGPLLGTQGSKGNRYAPAPKVLFVAPLDLGPTIVAYLVAKGLPTNHEGIEHSKSNMPEYKFSISAHHIKWCMGLLKQYGCVIEHSRERELYEVTLEDR